MGGKSNRLPREGLNNVFRHRSITSNYTVRAEDAIINADSTAGTVTITLTPSTIAGQTLFIKKIDSSGNNVVISRTGTDTIEGATSITLSSQYQSRTMVSDGNGKWYIQSST